MMSRSTVAALLIGLAIGCVSTRALQGAATKPGDVGAAVAALQQAQATALAEFQRSLERPAKEVIAALDLEAAPLLASGDYEKLKVLHDSRGPLGSKTRCEAIVEKRLAWCCVPGIYEATGSEWAKHQLLLARDGTFTLTPKLESGSSGKWEVKDGALVLKADRGWVKEFQIVPQFTAKGAGLRWHEDLAE